MKKNQTQNERYYKHHILVMMSCQKSWFMTTHQPFRLHLPSLTSFLVLELPPMKMLQGQQQQAQWTTNVPWNMNTTMASVCEIIQAKRSKVEEQVRIHIFKICFFCKCMKMLDIFISPTSASPDNDHFPWSHLIRILDPWSRSQPRDRVVNETPRHNQCALPKQSSRWDGVTE